MASSDKNFDLQKLPLVLKGIQNKVFKNQMESVRNCIRTYEKRVYCSPTALIIQDLFCLWYKENPFKGLLFCP
jgi:hypothetical protein